MGYETGDYQLSNTGKLGGIIRAYTGGLLSGKPEQTDAMQPISALLQIPTLNLDDQSDTPNNPYTPAQGSSWNQDDAGAHHAKQSSQSNSGGVKFNTDDWKQYTPQGLTNYVGNLVGNTISSLTSPTPKDTSPATTNNLTDEDF